MIKKVDHIAIVVKNLDEALKLYDDLFGAKPAKIETLPQQGVKAALLPRDLAPARGQSSPAAYERRRRDRATGAN